MNADLFGKKYFVKPAVLNNCPTDFFIGDPFEKEDESMYRSNKVRKCLKLCREVFLRIDLLQVFKLFGV